MQRTRFRARAAVVLLALGTSVLALPPKQADASVSIAVEWDDLVARSTAVAFMTPTDATVVWEGGRIVTYTHVNVDRAIAGPVAAGADAWIRTMGGIVGNVGQRVEGEAVFVPGHSSLLFLHDGPAGAFHVMERGQGQFPVVADGSHGSPYLASSPGVDWLVPPRVRSPALPPTLASEVLRGLTTDEAARQVASAWSRLHAN